MVLTGKIGIGALFAAAAPLAEKGCTAYRAYEDQQQRQDKRVDELEARLKRAERQLCIVGWTKAGAFDRTRRCER